MGAIVPRAVDALDPDDLLERLDLDAVLSRIDLDQLLDRLDLDAVLARVDLDALMARIDVDALIGRIDVDRLVQQVDVNALVGQVDVDALVQQVDVQALVGQVDVNALVADVDVQGLVGRLDLNQVLTEVDIAALMARAGIDQIVADATGGMAARTLDLARRQLLKVDLVVLALADRLAGRRSDPGHRGSDAAARPTGPDGPTGRGDDPDGGARGRAGRWAAGPVSRAVAFLVDSLAVSTLFGVAVSLGTFLVALFTSRSLGQIDGRGPWWAAAFLAWWFCYLWLSVAVSGRTIGKGLVGLRVLSAAGDDLPARDAAVRALVLPASMVLGLGFVPAVFGRQRRALHDLAARSRVDVDWGNRPVTVPAAWDRLSPPTDTERHPG